MLATGISRVDADFEGMRELVRPGYTQPGADTRRCRGRGFEIRGRFRMFGFRGYFARKETKK